MHLESGLFLYAVFCVTLLPVSPPSHSLLLASEISEKRSISPRQTSFAYLFIELWLICIRSFFVSNFSKTVYKPMRISIFFLLVRILKFPSLARVVSAKFVIFFHKLYVHKIILVPFHHYRYKIYFPCTCEFLGCAHYEFR